MRHNPWTAGYLAHYTHEPIEGMLDYAVDSTANGAFSHHALASNGDVVHAVAPTDLSDFNNKQLWLDFTYVSNSRPQQSPTIT